MGVSEFVDQNYTMNPETEKLLPNGTYLRDGMKVLIESPLKRQELKAHLPERMHRARLTNRWCVVSDIDIANDAIYFVGTYADGIKKKHSWFVQDAWLVKKESTPEFARDKELRELVEGIIEMGKVASDRLGENFPDQMVQKIVRLFEK